MMLKSLKNWPPCLFPSIILLLDHPKVSVLERSSCCDPLPEWGRSVISNFQFPPYLTHRTSRENQTDLTYSVSLIFPACSVSEMWWKLEIGNFHSSSFWRRIVPTARFNNWDKRFKNLRDNFLTKWPKMSKVHDCVKTSYATRQVFMLPHSEKVVT